MIVNYENAFGEPVLLDVPFSVGDMLFEGYCDFRTGEAKYIEAARSLRTEQTMDVEEAVQHLTAAVASLVKGNVEELQFAIPGDNMASLLDGGWRVTLGEDLSIMRLYSHLVATLRTFKPSEIVHPFSVVVQGKKYVLDSRRANTLLTGVALTTGEVLETLEYQRRAERIVEGAPLEVGNVDFNLGLTELALLLRPEGERLPADRAAREAIIGQRKQVFRKIGMDTVLTLRFFLLNSLTIYAITPNTVSFGRAGRVVLTETGNNPNSGKRQRKVGKRWGGLSFTTGQ